MHAAMRDPSVRLEVSRIKESDDIPAVRVAVFLRGYTQPALSKYPGSVLYRKNLVCFVHVLKYNDIIYFTINI